MPQVLFSFLALTLLSGSGFADDRIDRAIENALPLLERASAGSADQRECFTCHSQALPILALTEAQRHGFAVDVSNLRRQLNHTYAHLERNQPKYLEGKGTGGRADTAGYALWALSAGMQEGDGVTAAVAEYLLTWQASQQHWSCSSQRPPSEASDFTTTYLALRGLVEYGTDEQQARIRARTESACEWLVRAAPQDNEDRVFRLWGLDIAAADRQHITSAAMDLVRRQRDDGGWAQLADAESDVYATATALVALHRTGSIQTVDEVYQRGLKYLIGAQLDDGTWHVVSRSNPFQTYYESGFPHGDDQFISTAASAWAVIALLAACSQESRGDVQPAVRPVLRTGADRHDSLRPPSPAPPVRSLSPAPAPSAAD